MSDTLDLGARPKVRFTISDHVGSPDVSASVTLLADGLQRLPSDGRLTVNGQVIEAKRLQKQGFWYQDLIARADQYELQVRRGRGIPEDRQIIRPRIFVPHMPKALVRGADLRIEFDGPAPNPGERLFLTLTTAEAVPLTQSREIVLKGEVRGNLIVVPGNSLMSAVPGNAILYVGLTCAQPATRVEDTLIFAIGAEVPVRVTN